MDQTSEPVASSKAVRVNEARCARFTFLFRQALAEGALRAMLVVSHGHGQYPFKVRADVTERPSGLVQPGEHLLSDARCPGGDSDSVRTHGREVFDGRVSVH